MFGLGGSSEPTIDYDVVQLAKCIRDGMGQPNADLRLFVPAAERVLAQFDVSRRIRAGGGLLG